VNGASLQEVFESMLPDDVIDQLIAASGMQMRERDFQPRSFVRAAVLGAAYGQGGRQSVVLDAYFDMGARRVSRGGSYAWFSPAFEEAMESVAKRALAYARLQPLDLPGWIGKPVADWHAFDSMTVKLPKERIDVYPGAGNYAALKIHKRFSIGLGATVDYHISPARDHDCPHLVLDESWRGLGLLADLGYASFDRLRDAERFGVKYVIRLKEDWKPKVASIRAGDVRATFLPDSDFDDLLDDEVIALSGPSIDADVRLGRGESRVAARLVGVRHEGAYRYYLTNLGAEVTPEQISTLYRVRWEIELENKLNKSNFNIDAVRAEKPHTVRALVHASVAASTIVSVIAHRHRLEQRPPPRKGTERKTPPIHVHSLARALVVAANRIASAMELRGDAATEAWNWIADFLVFRAVDPNWRHRPSVLDQLRGWKVLPAPSRGGGKKPRKAAK
jgi:hypothetical protein